MTILGTDEKVWGKLKVLQAVPVLPYSKLTVPFW
jgi:hypothetical protein